MILRVIGILFVHVATPAGALLEFTLMSFPLVQETEPEFWSAEGALVHSLKNHQNHRG